MKKTRIELAILALVALTGLVLGLGVFARASNGRDSNNGRADFAPGRIIVKFKGDEKPFRVVDTPRGKEMAKVRKYQAKPNVVYAEPDYKMQALGPNENIEAYQNQWALNNTGQTIYHGTGDTDDPVDEDNPIGSGTEGSDVDFEEAYNSFQDQITGSSVVAVVDSGVDLNCSESEYEGHPDLQAKVTAGHDYIDGDDCPHDVYGHGTHVAGIAAADTDNGIGIAGVGFPSTVSVLAIRVLDEDGIGYTSDVAAGIREAAQGTQVINLSLGGRKSQTLKNAVDYAWDRGVLLAAAAGNDGGGRKYYPASYQNVISVAATNYNDEAASFSNFNSQVEISAPGVNVFSTFPTYEFTIGTKYERSRNYDVGSGTSMSVPHVVGLAGLLFAQDGSRSNARVRDIINQTADNLGKTGWDKHFGYGRINVDAALNYVPPVCGNGTVEGDEECDGSDLGGATCETLGYDGGKLSCTGDCTYDTSGCTTTSASDCGDGYCAGSALGEDCSICPDDCRCAGPDCSKACCGDGICSGENVHNCSVDCS